MNRVAREFKVFAIGFFKVRHLDGVAIIRFTSEGFAEFSSEKGSEATGASAARAKALRSAAAMVVVVAV
ncbi:hypothetical protein D3C87_2194050 [compost metagenome]